MIIIYKHLVLLASMLLATTIGSYAQSAPKLKFTHIGLAQGLSNSTVNCMIQDRIGFIWVGTDNGLNRYDGYQFVQIGNENDSNRLSSQEIKCLYEDDMGIIWIGTITGGLHRYDPATGRILHYTNDEKTEVIAGNSVRKICSDKLGNIWVHLLLPIFRGVGYNLEN